MMEQKDFLDKLDPAPKDNGAEEGHPPVDEEYLMPINEPEIPKIRQLSDKNIRDLIKKYLANPKTKKCNKKETAAFFIVQGTKHTSDDLRRTIEILGEEKDDESKYYWQKGDLA